MMCIMSTNCWHDLNMIMLCNDVFIVEKHSTCALVVLGAFWDLVIVGVLLLNIVLLTAYSFHKKLKVLLDLDMWKHRVYTF